MLTLILNTVLVLAVIALVIGTLVAVLGLSLKKDIHKVDKEILAILPGINCGGCGYPTCALYAEALRKGEAKTGKCRVMNKESAKKLVEYIENINPS